jgi:hypothetical protein
MIVQMECITSVHHLEVDHPKVCVVGIVRVKPTPNKSKIRLKVEHVLNNEKI